jgi:proteic killer suppression protein
LGLKEGAVREKIDRYKYFGGDFGGKPSCQRRSPVFLRLGLFFLAKCNQIGYTSIVIISFKDKETEDIYDGIRNKGALRRLSPELWRVAHRKFYALDHAVALKDLASPPNNRLEALKRDRKGQHSIRINDQFRICFCWTTAGPENVEITDYH